MSGEAWRKSYPLFGKHPRPFVDPFAPAGSGRADRARLAASFPEWCKPQPGVEQPWFRVCGTVYWGSVGRGVCRAWSEAEKCELVEMEPDWPRLKRALARRHGVGADAVEVRPNLPVWVHA